jgi:hypothetical protein
MVSLNAYRMIMARTSATTVTTEKDAQPDPESKDSAVERRAPQRVTNEQGTGSGSATALSKLKMIERRKNEWQQYERPSGE